jgi:uncharacterized DUF497 family protein
LDFADAWRVFERPLLRRLDDRKDYGETRWVAIGMLGHLRIVVIVFTEPDEQTIRIISMRKALTHERTRYEQAYRNRFGDF